MRRSEFESHAGALILAAPAAWLCPRSVPRWNTRARAPPAARHKSARDTRTAEPDGGCGSDASICEFEPPPVDLIGL